MKYAHSLPWRVVPEPGAPLIISSTQPGYIAQCFDDEGNGRKNAETIVKAVNTHREYADFIRILREAIEANPGWINADWLEIKLGCLDTLLSWASQEK